MSKAAWRYEVTDVATRRIYPEQTTEDRHTSNGWTHHYWLRPYRRIYETSAVSLEANTIVGQTYVVKGTCDQVPEHS